MEYHCYYCDAAFRDFSDVIRHTVDRHGQQPLKIRSLIIHPETGRRAYARRDFNVIPSEVHKRGQKIVGNESKNICLVPCDEDVASTASSQDPQQCESKTTEPIFADQGNFENSEDDFTLQLAKLRKLLPEVAQQFERNGLLSSWVLFHELVCKGLFDFENIAFHLFMDVVRFLGCENTSSMRYGDNSKLFWRIGFKLFHGKFLRFMSGPKSLGQVVEGSSESGRLVSSDAKVNFAVPTARYLETVATIKGELKPGLLEDCIKTVADKASQAKSVLMGKKSMHHYPKSTEMSICLDLKTLQHF